MLTPEKKTLVCEQCGEPLAGDSTATGCLNCLLLGGLKSEENFADGGQPSSDPQTDETLPDTGERFPSSAGQTSARASGARFYQHYEICLREDGSLLELGRGTMGVTYKAIDVNLRVPVALKVINARFSAQAHARARFLREAQSAARLRHPNVASVFHFGVVNLPTAAAQASDAANDSRASASGASSENNGGGECFYAMEFIEGETLEARVRRAGPLKPALALEVAAQVARALAAAERRGLIHRDLKPANIMLVTEGEITAASTHGGAGEAWVKVIDFGLAKAVGGETSAEKNGGENGAASWPELPLTHDGFLGTPQFASPEQYDGGEVDARSDIFSLGVTLWFALTGGLPFDGRSLAEIYDLQQHRPLPTELLADAYTPAPLVALLESMLATDPANRPASALVLRERIEQCQAAIQREGGQPPALRSPSADTTAKRRNRWLGMMVLMVALAALLAVGAAAWVRARKAAAKSAALATADKSIAVLPLENLSEGADNAFFAAGIQDDVIASLVKIKDLKVVGRSSVAQYKAGVARDLREISRQLGVTHVLEGSVRRDGFRVLVNVQLVDTRGDQPRLWAEHYDRTLADSLTLQGELATEIASALRATLSPAEKASVDVKPTADPDAYMLYLRGREYQTSTAGLLQDYRTAAQLYEEAIARDPDFALARARLSATLAYLYLQVEPTQEVKKRARAEAEEALRLQPNLGEGHLARALCVYWIDRDYDTALRELSIAASLLPSDTDIDATVAYIHRRQGRWSKALTGLRRVLARDPRNGQVTEELSFTEYHVRDWPAAARTGDRAVAVAPESPAVAILRHYVDFWWHNDIAPLRATLAKIPDGVDPDGFVSLSRWDAALIARDFAAAKRAVDACAMELPPNFNGGAPFPKNYLFGCIALAQGETDRARALLEAAVPFMENEAVNASPEDPFRHAQLGLLYAYLGRKEEALREGHQAMSMAPEGADAHDGPFVSSYMALIHARLGENDQALALIEHLLTVPCAVDCYEASISLADLRSRWQWDPLRQDARFQKILSAPEPKTILERN